MSNVNSSRLRSSEQPMVCSPDTPLRCCTPCSSGAGSRGHASRVGCAPSKPPGLTGNPSAPGVLLLLCTLHVLWKKRTRIRRRRAVGITCTFLPVETSAFTISTGVNADVPGHSRSLWAGPKRTRASRPEPSAPQNAPQHTIDLDAFVQRDGFAELLTVGNGAIGQIPALRVLHDNSSIQPHLLFMFIVLHSLTAGHEASPHKHIFWLQ